MSYLKVFIALVIAFLSVGCSSLSCLERESTLDKMDIVNGDPAQDGNRIARREAMAEKEILNREVQAEKNKGFRVEVVNYGYSLCRIEIRKASFLLENPVIVSLILPPDSVSIIYLMPGFYQENCVVDRDHWKKIREVTSAPSINKVSGNTTHCTMGNISKGRRHFYGSSRYNRSSGHVRTRNSYKSSYSYDGY